MQIQVYTNFAFYMFYFTWSIISIEKYVWIQILMIINDVIVGPTTIIELVELKIKGFMNLCNCESTEFKLVSVRVYILVYQIIFGVCGRVLNICEVFCAYI